MVASSADDEITTGRVAATYSFARPTGSAALLRIAQPSPPHLTVALSSAAQS
jgi:hypothetical protein